MRNKYIWVSIAAVAIGVILLLASGYFEADSVLGDLLSGLSSIIIVAGAFNALNEWYLRDQSLKEIIKIVKLEESISTLGIKDIQLGWQGLPHKELMESSQSQIDIVHAYANTWTNYNIDHLVKALKKPNLKMRVILLDPESEAAVSLHANQFNKTKEEMKEKVLSVVKEWESIYKQSGSTDPEKLKIYFHDGVQTLTLYRYDNTIISNQLRKSKIKKSSFDLPAIICEETANPNDLYKAYVEEIEELIKEARLKD
ncbi:hypothetical protein QUH71_01355 [Priestia aryabhattai]|uniref:hypothetical protein n=1 Tax=Priestia aryabhattai TaxID=412384 RepID=UPI0025A3B789|nr:hypothetical protein [Priestia aryabhattai]WJN45177.1 hypothetical protein QUH71_01355 [Priestia aryabhattai]